MCIFSIIGSVFIYVEDEMRKVFLIISMLLFSVNVFATNAISPNFSSTLLTSMQKHPEIKIIQSNYPMVYGGKDISRERVASADESIWAGQHHLVG